MADEREEKKAVPPPVERERALHNVDPERPAPEDAAQDPRARTRPDAGRVPPADRPEGELVKEEHAFSEAGMGRTAQGYDNWSRQELLEFAKEQGLQVPTDASRDEILDRLGNP